MEDNAKILGITLKLSFLAVERTIENLREYSETNVYCLPAKTIRILNFKQGLHPFISHTTCSEYNLFFFKTIFIKRFATFLIIMNTIKFISKEWTLFGVPE